MSASADPGQLILGLIETWGDAVCAWCLGVSPAQLDEYRDIFGEIPEVVELSARMLADVAATVLSHSYDSQPVSRHAAALGHLSRIDAGREHTPLNMIRLASGAALASIGDDDALVAAARWLGRDVLPCYLYLEAGSGGPDHDRDRDVLELGRQALFEGAGHEHPAIAAFEAAFATDPRFDGLRGTFATERPLAGTDISVSGSAYLSGDTSPDTPMIRASDLPRTLVEAAWDRQLLLGDPDPARALDHLPGVLTELVSGLDGVQIAVPACVGLRGLMLPGGNEGVSVRGGVLRPPTVHELRRTDGDDPIGCVLQMRLKARMEVSAAAPERLWRRWHEPPWTRLAGYAEAVALASTLASDADWPAGVTIAWAAVCGPTGPAALEAAPGGRPEELVQLD